LKEAYAVRRTVPPSAEIEEQIDRLLAVGVGENPREALSELAKLGARLISICGPGCPRTVWSTWRESSSKPTGRATSRQCVLSSPTT
jgi:hypothetical protein